MFRTQLLASAAAGALFVVALEHGLGGDAVAGARTPATPAPAVTTGRIASGLPDFSALVAQASPAVVSIRVTKAIATAGAPGPALPPGFEFFRRFAPEGLPRQPDMPVEGAGSGFIISADGHVLTNAHVVDGADEITVRLADKREYQAKVLGIDATTDVAVLKLPARGLPTLRVGDTNALAVGEWVIAIGSPFGFDHTVSAGVVSAKTRSLPNGGYVPFIQTDVALNPGNSGGPLLNLRGEVVGINSQIYSRSGGYMGLSFAIPIDLAMNVQAELVAHGKVSRGRLGVMVQSVDQALAESFGLPRPAGALIGAVEPGLAAARAGLRPGDVITAVNGGAIEDSAMLSRVIAEQKPGSRVRLEVLREGRARTLEVALGASGDATTVADTGTGATAPGRLGAVVRDLDGHERRSAGLDRGVLVTDATGAAARAGLRPGDIILAVNTHAVKDAADLKSHINDAPAHVALLVRREGAEIFVPVELG